MSFNCIFISRIERLFFFKYLIERWHGYFSNVPHLLFIARPISVAVYVLNNTEETTEFEKNKLTLPTQSTFRYSVFYSNTDVYSYNQLRNIAIKSSITSHIYISDMDFWPSSIYFISFCLSSR